MRAGRGSQDTRAELTLWFCFLVVCGVLWWLYYDYTNDLSTELDTERENMKCVLGFAIVSSVITVRNALPAAA
jgi:hypothetical protein